MGYKERGIENFWKLSVLDQFMYGHSGFIAGGCFKNILQNEKINDVDIYFESKKDFDDACKYFKEKVDEKEYRNSYKNKKVTAFVCLKNGIRVELIKSTFGKPKDLIDNFDFTIAKFAYYKELDDDDNVEYKIVHHEDFFEHLQTKRLVIDNKLLFPISTFERTYKYRDYGFRLCKESKVKLIDEINSQEFIDEESFSKSFYDGFD